MAPCTSPRAISTRPAPPASTTPASRRTSSISGVRARASSPRASTAARSSSGASRRFSFFSALLGHLADDGQHRPLDRALDRAVRGVARTAERAAEPRGAGLLGLAEHLDEPADDLGEDDARVARAPMRAARVTSFATSALPPALDGVERLHDRSQREDEVRARVAVGDGIDVEVVDPPAVCLEVPQRAAASWRTARAPSATSDAVDVHLERGDGKPDHALELVEHPLADRRRDLGELQPVLDDDASSIARPSSRSLDVDALPDAPRNEPRDHRGRRARRRRSSPPPRARRSGRSRLGETAIRPSSVDALERTPLRAARREEAERVEAKVARSRGGGRRATGAAGGVRAPSGPCRPSGSACRRMRASRVRRAARGRAAGSG